MADDIPELAIAVEDGRRGEGIGTKLLTSVIAMARIAGHRSISLSVADGNTAQVLYDAMGFISVGRNEDSDTMILDLSK